MSSKSVMRTTLATPAALVLSVILGGQAAAASWSDATRIATGLGYAGPYSSELAPLVGSTAVVGYGMTNSADIWNVVVRRTPDSGATWKKPTVITDHGYAPSTAGRGSDVDVTWLWNGVVHYAHSADAGRTFGDEMSLSPTTKHAFNVRVARGPHGVVAIVWDQEGVVRARVSTNGGVSFLPGTTIAQRGFFPRVAVGNGVIYVLYAAGEYDFVRVVRSLNNGASWGAAFTAGVADSVYYSITAEESRAYIAYESTTEDTFWGLDYRGTDDKGSSWTQARSLLPASWSGYDPMLSLHHGVLRATFVPCHDSGDYCDDSGRMVYRQSHDGLHWSKPEYISPKGLYPEPRGIWFAGKPIVLYEANTTRYYVPVLFARTRAT